MRHPFCDATLARLVLRLRADKMLREEGETLSQVMWCLAFIGLVGVVVVLGHDHIAPFWREFVGDPTR